MKLDQVIAKVFEIATDVPLSVQDVHRDNLLLRKSVLDRALVWMGKTEEDGNDD